VLELIPKARDAPGRVSGVTLSPLPVSLLKLERIGSLSNMCGIVTGLTGTDKAGITGRSRASGVALTAEKTEVTGSVGSALSEEVVNESAMCWR
jgi:hypothetical protein